jgi:hypothetical protein
VSEVKSHPVLGPPARRTVGELLEQWYLADLAALAPNTYDTRAGRVQNRRSTLGLRVGAQPQVGDETQPSGGARVTLRLIHWEPPWVHARRCATIARQLTTPASRRPFDRRCQCRFNGIDKWTLEVVTMELGRPPRVKMPFGAESSVGRSLELVGCARCRENRPINRPQ